MRCCDARADRWSWKTSTRPTAPSSTGRGSEPPSRWVPVTRSGSDGPRSRSSRTSAPTTRSCRHPCGRIRSHPPRRHRPVVCLAEEQEDATQPLPSRTLESGTRPARSNRRWLGVGAVLLAVLVGVIAYAALVDRSAENDFATSATEACSAVQRPEPGLDLSRAPTRGELQHARNIRLQALGAIRALGRPEEDAVPVSRFLSAFGETNASIAGLERAIGADNRRVARAVRKPSRGRPRRTGTCGDGGYRGMWRSCDPLGRTTRHPDASTHRRPLPAGGRARTEPDVRGSPGRGRRAGATGSHQAAPRPWGSPLGRPVPAGGPDPRPPPTPERDHRVRHAGSTAGIDSS